MKLSESINFVPFYDKIKSQSMPVATAYKLAKVYKAAKEDESFYQEKLREILFQYGELDADGNLIPIEDGKGIKLKPDVQKDCIKAITELQEIESACMFEPLDIAILDGIEITPSDLEDVMGFFN